MSTGMADTSSVRHYLLPPWNCNAFTEPVLVQLDLQPLVQKDLGSPPGEPQFKPADKSVSPSNQENARTSELLSGGSRSSSHTDTRKEGSSRSVGITA